ncbi:T9SS type A sorting domain-containing protein [bacterium]|nr:T9SS type A sorting domain-containing protein [bacterium]
MNLNYHSLASLVLLTILLSSLSALAQEDPRLWNAEGIAVRQGTYLQWQRATAVNDQGQTCVVWADTRSGLRSVYAQMIDTDGSLLWETGGLQIASADWNLFNPAVTAVSDGWVFAWLADGLWTGEGIYSAQRLYAQKANWNGVNQWPEGGVELLYDPDYYICEDDYGLHLVHDGNGGALLTWLDGWGNYDIFAARILANGSLDWGGVLAVTTIQGSQIPETVVSDGSGNMIIAWADDRDLSNRNIYAAKVMANGTLPWGEGVNGVPICTAANRQLKPRLCPDFTSGGAYCIWIDENQTYDRVLYAQRINGAGASLWQLNGILIGGTLGDSYASVGIKASVADDIQDGFVCCWNDVRENGIVSEVYAQKVNPDGSMLWGENGTLVCGDAGPAGTGNTRDGSRIISDLAGGAIINWNDTRNSNGNTCQYDLYAARLNSGGLQLWGDCGVLIADGLDAQQDAALTLSGAASIVDALYVDEASSGSQDLKHQRIALADGTLLLETADILLADLDGSISGYPKTIEIADDRAAIVWEDWHGGTYGTALYYQIVNADGEFELPVQGSQLVPDNDGYEHYDQSDVTLTSDGNGGFYAVFVDLRTGVRVVRLVKVNQQGEITCDPAGVIVSQAITDQQDAVVCPDGNGGCYVAWSENDLGFTLDVYLQHFDENCQATWFDPVQLTSDGTVDDVVEGLAQSSDCCILVWETGITTQYDIHAARVCPGGTVDWNRTVCDAPRRQDNNCLIEDGSEGVFVSWFDNRLLGHSAIYVQHIDSEGNDIWEYNGMRVILSDEPVNRPIQAFSEQNGLYVIWEDFRNGSNLDLYAQRIDDEGNLLWDEAGLLLCGESGDQQTASIAINESGGVFAAWTDGRGFWDDIYGTNLLPNGQPSDEWWEEGSGGVICEIAEHQTMPVLAPLSADQTLLAWVDWRSTEREPVMDLYMQSINIGIISKAETQPEIVPSAFALHQNYPNPFNPSTTIAFTLPQAGQTSLVVYDLLGRTVETLIEKQLPAGNYHTLWNAQALPSGVYFYRLTSGEFTDVKKTVLIK